MIILFHVRDTRNSVDHTDPNNDSSFREYFVIGWLGYVDRHRVLTRNVRFGGITKRERE